MDFYRDLNSEEHNGYGPKFDIMTHFDKMHGGRIINIGFHPDIEGGLTIDYEKDNEIHRIIFGYTELGTWVEDHKPLQEK